MSYAIVVVAGLREHKHKAFAEKSDAQEAMESPAQNLKPSPYWGLVGNIRNKGMSSIGIM